MATSVARLLDPKFLATRDLSALFIQAFEGSPVFPAGFVGMLPDMYRLVQDHDRAIFLIGSEDEIPKALCIILLPTDKITPYPQVLHIYNGGGVALRKKLIKAGVETLREKGYMSFVAVNATGKPDSVWARTFRLAGKSRVIGGIVEFELPKG